MAATQDPARRRGEARLPAAVATAVAIGIYALLPGRLILGRTSRTSGWVPGFIDYLYVSVTNSTAFSPTDTMPLTSRAKILMTIESIAALLTSILVIARGVSILQ